MSFGCDWSFDLLGMAHARAGLSRWVGLLGGDAPRLPLAGRTGDDERRGGASRPQGGGPPWSGTQIATEGVRGGRKTVTRLPSGKAPEPLRARRTKREATAGTTTHPKRNNRVMPSATPADTSEPAPPQRAAFRAH